MSRHPTLPAGRRAKSVVAGAWPAPIVVAPGAKAPARFSDMAGRCEGEPAAAGAS